MAGAGAGHTAQFVRWRPGRDRRSAPAARLRACPDLNAGQGE